MRLDSIRHRLLAIIVIFLLSMLLLVLNQIFNVNRLIDIQSHAESLASLESDLLQLRRHEKDFLLRQELQYVDEFNQRAEIFAARLNEVEQIHRQYRVPEALFQSAQSSFSAYRDRFADLVSLQVDIGLDEDSGQQGQFRDAVHRLEEISRAAARNQITIDVLQLRRLEKDFMLRRDMNYASEHERLYLDLRLRLAASDLPNPARALLDQYRAGFSELVQSYQAMGLTPDTGLQGEFREAAHSIEVALADVDEALSPLIEERQSNVRRSGLVILVLAALLLSSLLFRAFFNLQHAFTTLIMFFYRCKREFELLDERKIYFAEFKALASVVNEMIQARKEMEYELKETRERLSRYEDTSSAPG